MISNSFKYVYLSFIFALFTQSHGYASSEQQCSLNGKAAHLMTLSVGDWSGDGHEQTAEIVVCSSLNRMDLQQAYIKASKQMQFDFSEEVAKDYEDSLLSDDAFDKLVNAGVPLNESDKELDSVLFARIWLKIATLGADELEFQILISPANINIGGYGLFY